MIIGLIGLKGSGKSTLAKMLCEHHNFQTVKFAAPLKAMLAVLMEHQGASPAEITSAIEGASREQPNIYFAGRTPRHTMQTLGTEWGRQLIDADLWTRVWSQAAARHERVVCDDVRFVNEANVVRAQGGKLVRIEYALSVPDTHISEKVMASIVADHHIINVRGNPQLMLKRIETQLNLTR